MSRTSRRAGPGFSLIELLVVIVIIALLISVVFAVAGGVSERGRVTQTREILRQLDLALDNFTANAGGIPPPIVLAPNPDPTNDRLSAYPMADAADFTAGSTDTPIINGLGLFIVEAERRGLAELFAGVPAARLGFHDPDDANGGRQPELRTVFDAWGAPIRFVHPEFDGVINEVSLTGDVAWNGVEGVGVDLFAGPSPMPADIFVLARSALPDGYDVEDAMEVPITRIKRDVEGDSGFCPNGRPYFYSVGKDGNPATAADSNVYTTEPRFLTPPGP